MARLILAGFCLSSESVKRRIQAVLFSDNYFPRLATIRSTGSGELFSRLRAPFLSRGQLEFR